jgi:hypothetical protein
MTPERGWDGPYHRPGIAAYMRWPPMNIGCLGDMCLYPKIFGSQVAIAGNAMMINSSTILIAM